MPGTAGTSVSEALPPCFHGVSQENSTGKEGLNAADWADKARYEFTFVQKVR